MGKYLLWWLLIWTIIGGIVYTFFSKDGVDVLYGVAVAAFISLLFLFKMLSENYEGEIINLREETYYVTDEGGGSNEKRITATIKMPNGKTKNIPAVEGYEVGNYIIKKRGEPSPKLFVKKPD